jgi:hypothetical protein
MRVRLLKSSFILGSLMCVATIVAGCTQLSNGSLPGQSDSTALTSPAASPGSQELPTPATGGAKQQTRSAQSQSTSSVEWLLQPGLFGVKHGIWLGWTSLTFGLSGIGLALFIRHQSARAISQLSQRLSRITRDIERADSSINRISMKGEQDSKSIINLQAAYHQLEDKHAAILASISSLRIQQKIEPQNYAIPMPSQISTPLVTQLYQPSPAEKQAELTAAVNRGDRQLVKSETRAHLNITHASENAISMGRLNETQLEEVSAGGSYWAASCGGEVWLYPTEQTLKGYIQSQRPTGIFNYTQQPISSAQVVSPARLTLNGTLWQVVEMGSIAVPG